jgi:hypothetical protein
MRSVHFKFRKARALMEPVEMRLLFSTGLAIYSDSDTTLRVSLDDTSTVAFAVNESGMLKATNVEGSTVNAYLDQNGGTHGELTTLDPLVADFNDDGIKDFATVFGLGNKVDGQLVDTVEVDEDFSGLPTTSFYIPASSEAGVFGYNTLAGNVDGTGHADIVTETEVGQVTSWAVYQQNSTAPYLTFTYNVGVNGTDSLYPLLGDFNGGGKEQPVLFDADTDVFYVGNNPTNGGADTTYETFDYGGGLPVLGKPNGTEEVGVFHNLGELGETDSWDFDGGPLYEFGGAKATDPYTGDFGSDSEDVIHPASSNLATAPLVAYSTPAGETVADSILKDASVL